MLKAIRYRRSVRSFTSKPVEKEKIEEILKAVMFTPSANHRRPWEFVVVKDNRVKDKLSQATPWASFAKEAAVIIVVCANEAASREWLEDASIVGAHIYLEATNQGLGTCWIQIRDSVTPDGRKAEEYVRKILGIPQEFRVVALFPIGYPSDQLSPHSDKEFEKDKLHFDHWRT